MRMCILRRGICLGNDDKKILVFFQTDARIFAPPESRDLRVTCSVRGKTTHSKSLSWMTDSNNSDQIDLATPPSAAFVPSYSRCVSRRVWAKRFSPAANLSSSLLHSLILYLPLTPFPSYLSESEEILLQLLPLGRRLLALPPNELEHLDDSPGSAFVQLLVHGVVSLLAGRHDWCRLVTSHECRWVRPAAQGYAAAFSTRDVFSSVSLSRAQARLQETRPHTSVCPFLSLSRRESLLRIAFPAPRHRCRRSLFLFHSLTLDADAPAAMCLSAVYHRECARRKYSARSIAWTTIR